MKNIDLNQVAKYITSNISMYSSKKDTVKWVENVIKSQVTEACKPLVEALRLLNGWVEVSKPIIKENMPEHLQPFPIVKKANDALKANKERWGV